MVSDAMNVIASARTIDFLSAAALFLLSVPANAADDNVQQFIWRDGSSLSGHIASATKDEMIIVSPTFAMPLVIDSSVIGEVQFPRVASSGVEPFVFSLKDGTSVTGSIASITEKQVIARNRTLGEFVLLLSDLLSIQRTSEEAAPPSDILPPAEKPAAPKPEPIAKPKDAQLPGTFHASPLPERCDIVLKMRTQPKPTFRVVITGANNRKVTLEAKNGDLILQGRVFFLLKNIDTADGAVNLHLYWNQQTGQCALCTSNGVCLGDTTKGPVGGAATSNAQGVRIEHTEPNFAIAFLGVNSWDGMVPRANETVGPGVMLTDDTSIQGRVIAANATGVDLRGVDGRVRAVPMEKIFRIRFDPVRTTPTKQTPVALWFADGSHLDGKLTGIRDGVVTFETALTSTPLNFKTEALRQMIVRNLSEAEKSAPSPAADTLRIGDKVVFGTLEEGDAGVHWKPTGARRSVPISKGVEFSIARSAETAPADGVVFHLVNGEVLSGKLIGMNQKEIEGEWAFGSSFKLPVEMVRAVQFASDRLNITGFADEAWKPSADQSSAVSLKAQEATLSGRASVSHPEVMRASEIRFRWQPTGSYCDFELTLFNSEAASTTTGVQLRLYCGQSKARVLMQDAGAARFTAELGSVWVDMTKPMDVRMEVLDDSVALQLNDSTPIIIPAEAARRAGNGLSFGIKQSSGRIVINGVINGQAIIQNFGHTSPIRVWDFAATTSATSMRPAGGVIAAVRDEALRIPRFRQDAPPKHVIVAANRDLLRGEVEAIAADHLLFRSGLETVRVPLSRLAAIVTPMPVKKDEQKQEGQFALLPDGFDGTDANDGKSDAAAQPLTFVTLNSGGRVGVMLDAIRDGNLTGKHPLTGDCRIPLAKVIGLDNGVSRNRIASHALDVWRWEYAPEPVLPETGGESSLLLGKDASLFKLPLLGGGEFDLAEEKGKIVVLDFWATWCGPCVKSLPDLIGAMSAFPNDKVKFIGVNQGEGGEVVKRFLEARKLKLTVAMDGAQSVARQYGVDGIPHTVIIGRDGKIAWVKSGFSAEGIKEAAAAVEKLLKVP